MPPGIRCRRRRSRSARETRGWRRPVGQPPADLFQPRTCRVTFGHRLALIRSSCWRMIAGAADAAPDRPLVEDDPCLQWRVLVEEPLPLHAQVHHPADLFLGVPGPQLAQHRQGVVGRLQQPVDHVRLVAAQPAGLRLQAQRCRNPRAGRRCRSTTSPCGDPRGPCRRAPCARPGPRPRTSRAWRS